MFGKPLRLFVDDQRWCPKGWIQAKSVTEAIRILATQPVDEVSLDHDIVDLGLSHFSSPMFSEESFFAVAYYIALMKYKPKVRIHTANIHKGYEMAKVLGIEYDGYFYDPKDYDIEVE